MKSKRLARFGRGLAGVLIIFPIFGNIDGKLEVRGKEEIYRQLTPDFLLYRKRFQLKDRLAENSEGRKLELSGAELMSYLLMAEPFGYFPGFELKDRLAENSEGRKLELSGAEDAMYDCLNKRVIY